MWNVMLDDARKAFLKMSWEVLKLPLGWPRINNFASYIHRRRSKTTLLAFIILTGYIGKVLQAGLQLEMERKAYFSRFGHVNTSAAGHRALRKVIISSYLKGGGNFIGTLLKSKPDTFYSFEPLFLLSTWSYYKSNAVKCSYFQNTCDDGWQTSAVALEKIRAVFSCTLATLVGNLYHPRWNFGGNPWEDYYKCIGKGWSKDNTMCQEKLSQVCQGSNVRLTKVERLSVSLLEQFLKEDPAVSVIHVFRDPRAIIYTIQQSELFSQLSTLEGIAKYAESLCLRMDEDYNVGTKIPAKYSTQFSMLLYEDFLADIDGVLGRIAFFAGIPLASSDKAIFQSAIREALEALAMQTAMDEYHVTNDAIRVDGDNLVIKIPTDTESNSAVENTGNRRRPSTKEAKFSINNYLHPFHWRAKIDYRTMKIIDSKCSKIYRKLGYNSYRSEDELRDTVNWPSFGGKGLNPF